jgi:hypothetical protein
MSGPDCAVINLDNSGSLRRALLEGSENYWGALMSTCLHAASSDAAIHIPLNNTASSSGLGFYTIRKRQLFCFLCEACSSRGVLLTGPALHFYFTAHKCRLDCSATAVGLCHTQRDLTTNSGSNVPRLNLLTL